MVLSRIIYHPKLTMEDHSKASPRISVWFMVFNVTYYLKLCNFML